MSDISDGVNNAQLDIDDKADVVNALTDVQSRYYEIGTQLHLRALDTIKNRSTTDTIAMTAIIDEWLSGNYNTTRFGVPTWKKLVDVVANPTGGKNKFLAGRIASEHRDKASSTSVPVPEQSLPSPPQVAVPSSPLTQELIMGPIDPDFFDETLKRVETDGKRKSYNPPPNLKIYGIKLSFGTITPLQGEKRLTEAGEYDMKKWPHGIAVIINNEHFWGGLKDGLRKREGTEVDERNMIQVLSYLGYIVEVYQDCSAAEIYQIMSKLSGRDHSRYDSFICCILSHGLEGQIYGSDGIKLDLNAVTTLFEGNNCHTLKEKPKIFIIQTCRGGMKEKGVLVPDSGVRVTSDSADRIPRTTDFFFGYATPPGFAAWRNTVEGSWYIYELCSALASYAQYSHLDTIMKKTCEMVCTNDKEYKQCPEIVARLRKDVFFF